MCVSYKGKTRFLVTAFIDRIRTFLLLKVCFAVVSKLPPSVQIKMVQILVMNSRHSNLYKKFESEGYANVLANMARLLSEEKEYEDKGNSGISATRIWKVLSRSQPLLFLRDTANHPGYQHTTISLNVT